MPRTKQLRYNQFKVDPYCWAFDNLEETSKASINSLINDTINQYKIVVLELCAGYCEYSLELAKNNPDTLYIAVDIKQDRLMSGCLMAREANLTNICFLSCDIANLALLFGSNIDNILLVHPDPQPKNQRQRLNQLKHFTMYYILLKAKGSISLITDNQDFYQEFVNNYDRQIWQEVNIVIEILKTRYNKIFVDCDNLSKVISLEKSKKD